jgi:DTW domain-containing protein YfiP
VCYCAHVEPVETRTRVLFLQHPREHGNPVGTVHMARLCLPNSELRVGVEFGNDPVVCAALSDRARPAALLFPGPDSVDLRQAPPSGPITLVVVDGTWSQAARLLRLNPALRSLPQYRLTPSRPGSYRIRREPAEHCVSTIEALAEVLGVLEGDPARLAKLLAPFEYMVDRQLAYIAANAGTPSRHWKPRAAPKPRPVPRVLRERRSDVVVAYGEASAWPFDTPDAPPAEIVHWVARRLGTGETFEAVVVPRHPLAPAVEHHTGLARERILAGESREMFRARWAAFLRPADVLCTWGTYAADVLANEGVTLPERFDLRVATALHLGARTGALETCVATLGATMGEPWAAGRAGRRVAAITAIAETLASR